MKAVPVESLPVEVLEITYGFDNQDVVNFCSTMPSFLETAQYWVNKHGKCYLTRTPRHYYRIYTEQEFHQCFHIVSDEDE